MKQQTTWYAVYNGLKGTYINVGYIHHKSKGNPADVIRVKIHSATCDVEFNARIDEAQFILYGLSRTLLLASLGNFDIKERK